MYFSHDVSIYYHDRLFQTFGSAFLTESSPGLLVIDGDFPSSVKTHIYYVSAHTKGDSSG